MFNDRQIAKITRSTTLHPLLVGAIAAVDFVTYRWTIFKDFHEIILIHAVLFAVHGIHVRFPPKHSKPTETTTTVDMGQREDDMVIVFNFAKNVEITGIVTWTWPGTSALISPAVDSLIIIDIKKNMKNYVMLLQSLDERLFVRPTRLFCYNMVCFVYIIYMLIKLYNEFVKSYNS